MTDIRQEKCKEKWSLTTINVRFMTEYTQDIIGKPNHKEDNWCMRDTSLQNSAVYDIIDLMLYEGFN